MENNTVNHAGLGTRAVWSGEAGERWGGSTQVPVALSVSFGYRTVEEWLQVALGLRPGHIYGRSTPGRQRPRPLQHQGILAR